MRMTEAMIVMGTCLALAGLTGCASSNQGQGATGEQTNTLSGAAQGQPEPISSPSFRPGMNRNDPRDPLFQTRPQPMTYPPQVTQ